MRRALRRTGLVVLVIFGALQLIPYGWRHENPPETSVARLADSRAAALFENACADCHSNRTDWPIYSFVAPASWLVRRDVEEGREKFNISEYKTSPHDADDAADELEDGDMPPLQYELAHPDARLSAEERATLVAALEELDRQFDDDRGPDDARNDAARNPYDRSGTNSGPG